jgi:hypothetical protein
MYLRTPGVRLLYLFSAGLFLAETSVPAAADTLALFPHAAGAVTFTNVFWPSATPQRLPGRAAGGSGGLTLRDTADIITLCRGRPVA